MTVITAVPSVVAVPKRSWSDIVKGRSEAKVEPLHPAERGSHLCVCTGQFLVMLGHYGWIMALQDIDHPDADRHGGRIYLRASDLRSGACPKEGDDVTFFLYSDANGLGAEDCYVTGEPHPDPPKAQQQVCARWREDKPRCFPPSQAKLNRLSADAQEFVPTVKVPVELNAEAFEFVPPPPGLGITTRAVAPVVIPDAILAETCVINTKRFFADSDDEFSDDGTESTASGTSGEVMVAPGLSTRFVSNTHGKPEHWSNVGSRCAQAVEAADDSSSSWCDESDEEESMFSPPLCSPPLTSEAEKWASVSSRCAEAVGRLEHHHSWHVRTAAAAAKLRAEVGDDIRWDVVLDALEALDESPGAVGAPPGLDAPPGLAAGFAPPGLEAPPGLA